MNFDIYNILYYVWAAYIEACVRISMPTLHLYCGQSNDFDLQDIVYNIYKPWLLHMQIVIIHVNSHCLSPLSQNYDYTDNDYDHREGERQRTDNMQGCVHHYFVRSWRLPALEEKKATHILA